MLRFIIQTKFKDGHTGCEVTSFETIDIDAPDLEKLLDRGGNGNGGYLVSSLAGVEILEETERLRKAKGTPP